MPRPKKFRRVFTYIFSSGDIMLEPDELEAVKLIDYEHRTQEDASKIMGISQPTFNRILKSAREKIARSLMERKEIGIKKIKGGDIMKIAIPSIRGGLEDTINSVFGRAPTFTIVDVENKEIKNVEIVQNPANQMSRGVGVRVAQFLINKGVNVVIANNIGPNVSMILTNANIKYYSTGPKKIKDAIEEIIQ